jgi:putative membrane protein
MSMKKLSGYLGLCFKGMGMGAANVIPGVSGGTIALITGIFEELIDSIKSFDLVAVKLLFTGKFKQLAGHINLNFLLAVFIGVGISIFSIAIVLDYLFVNYPIYIWSYFFGLILASVYFVGKTIEKWSASTVISFIIGTVVAVSITLINPATEDSRYWYLALCGVVAVCSMILPGLSGSFVLILMGNYQLVMIDAVTNLKIDILLPVVIGAVVGLIVFSHVLSWIYKKFKDQTISLLTGFILGSLAILWPWKNSYDQYGKLIPVNKYGAFLDQTGAVTKDIKVFNYDHIMPGQIDRVVLLAVIFAIAGIISIWLIEKFALKKSG